MLRRSRECYRSRKVTAGPREGPRTTGSGSGRPPVTVVHLATEFGRDNVLTDPRHGSLELGTSVGVSPRGTGTGRCWVVSRAYVTVSRDGPHCVGGTWGRGEEMRGVGEGSSRRRHRGGGGPGEGRKSDRGIIPATRRLKVRGVVADDVLYPPRRETRDRS